MPMERPLIMKGGSMRNDRVANHSVHLLIVAGLSMALYGCGTTPKYFESSLPAPKLGCFNATERAKIFTYTTSDTKERSCLFDKSLSRMNAIFSGKNGIYHSIFAREYTQTSLPCTDDHVADNADAQQLNPEFMDRSAVVSPISLPISDGGGNQSPSTTATATNNVTVNLPSSKTSAKDAGSNTNQSTATAAVNPEDHIDPAKDIQTVSIVISSFLYSNHPADRLDKVYAAIMPIDPGVTFENLGKLTPVQTVVKFGQVTTTANPTFSPIPLGSLSGQPISVTPGFSRSWQREINRQYATQNAEIWSGKDILMISEDGGPEQADLSGSRSVTATIKIDRAELCRQHRIYSYHTAPEAKKDKEQHPAPTQLTGENICYVSRIPAIMGSIAVARLVAKGGGDGTIEEGDDSVQLHPYQNLISFDLWKNSHELYDIQVGNATLMRYVNQKPIEPVLFGDPVSAFRFKIWLEQFSSQPKAYQAFEEHSYPLDTNDKMGFPQQVPMAAFENPSIHAYHPEDAINGTTCHHS